MRKNNPCAWVDSLDLCVIVHNSDKMMTTIMIGNSDYNFVNNYDYQFNHYAVWLKCHYVLIG